MQIISFDQKLAVADWESSMGWDWGVSLMGYNSDWKDCRRILHESLNAKDTHIYHADILGSSRELCRRLIDHPDNFLEHLR
jgi:hypothetical protein